MPAEPLYYAQSQQPAFALRYTWSGWATSGDLCALPDNGWGPLTAAWETDGLRLLERNLHSDSVLLTFSTTPQVNPVFLAARAKGRLQHAFRTSAVAAVD